MRTPTCKKLPIIKPTHSARHSSKLAVEQLVVVVVVGCYRFAVLSVWLTIRVTDLIELSVSVIVAAKSRLLPVVVFVVWLLLVVKSKPTLVSVKSLHISRDVSRRTIYHLPARAYLSLTCRCRLLVEN